MQIRLNTERFCMKPDRYWHKVVDVPYQSAEMKFHYFHQGMITIYIYGIIRYYHLRAVFLVFVFNPINFHKKGANHATS